MIRLSINGNYKNFTVEERSPIESEYPLAGSNSIHESHKFEKYKMKGDMVYFYTKESEEPKYVIKFDFLIVD
ncbi:MAG: hypothetical protein M1481_03840 [Candidatus Thermoplasmatota archaeon]|jgi:hypothetical protein|nr:hypothetical protein [Candidatus Thermoplasmatota archaeon]MCL5963355.1 hypothetical protein [Candidatus Thermoplasmatota archaeon]